MLEGLASAPNRDDRVARADPPCDVRDELRARPARSDICQCARFGDVRCRVAEVGGKVVVSNAEALDYGCLQGQATKGG